VQFWDVATTNTVQVDARPLWFWDFAFSPLGGAYAFFGADGLIGVAKAPQDPPPAAGSVLHSL
jgi:hypothetical protein